MTEEFKPTEEQQEIVEASKIDGSLMVSAYAGCSKTTTIALAGKEIKKQGIALAFNVRNRDDLSTRFNSNFMVKTLNGLGHMAWARREGIPSRLSVDSKKLGKIISGVDRDHKLKLTSDQWSWARQLVSKAMLAGLVPEEFGPGALPDTDSSWLELLEEMWVPENEQELVMFVGKEGLKINITQALQGIISYDDQIYCPTMLGGRWPKFPVVIADEVQDFSYLNQLMLSRIMDSNSKLIAVGDQKQSIYGFRGALTNSMQELRAVRPGWIDKKLTLTFRCPKMAVERQKHWAPGFRAFEKNKEGNFQCLPKAIEGTELLSWSWKQMQALLASNSDSIAILCRNNAPLFSTAFRLLRQRVSVQLLGSNIGKGLQGLVRKVSQDTDGMGIGQFLGLLTEWYEEEKEKALKTDREEKIAGLADRYESLLAIVDGSEAKDVRQLLQGIEKLFAQTQGQVTLSTIHKAKGMEWDAVVHLDPWRIPSKQAKQAAGKGDKEGLNQEYNLLYVCETRTKNLLVNANAKELVKAS